MLSAENTAIAGKIEKSQNSSPISKETVNKVFFLVICLMSYELSGFASRDSSCDANGPRNIKNTNPAKQRSFFFPPLLVVRNRSWKCLNDSNSHCDSCDNKTLRFDCPRSTRETDGIIAKLSRCGIASEALRRNLPLSL